MAYSKIVEIKVANLATLANAKFVFDESGILNIKGYNDSGKSALLQGIAMNLMNLIPRVQSKFIRYDADFFRVSILFDDGVEIIRDKYINGQSLYEMKKDGELVFSTKVGKTLTKVDGVPQVIADYLGLCVTENGCINYQSRRNPLFLIDTTGSQNYADLHQVLKLEQVSRANGLANSAKNSAASEVTQLEAEIQTKELRIVEMKDISKHLVKSLSARESYAQGLEEQKDSLEEASNTIKSIESLVDIPVINAVSPSRLEGIQSLLTNYQALESIPVIPDIYQVDCHRMKTLNSVQGIISQLKDLAKSSIPALPKVDESGLIRTSKLKESLGIMKELSDCVLSLKDTKHELKEAKTLLRDYVIKARKEGHVFTKCENCGSFVKVEVGGKD